VPFTYFDCESEQLLGLRNVKLLLIMVICENEVVIALRVSKAAASTSEVFCSQWLIS